jgi:putative oxidoreductase
MTVSNTELLVGRVLLGALFLFAGVAKILTPSLYIAHMAEHHIPAMLLWAVIALELAGGLAILFGWRTSLTALAMAGFCVLTAMIFHLDLADKVERTQFIKDLAIAGGLLILAARQ